MQVGIPLIVIFPRAALETARCYKNGWRAML